MGKNQTHKAMQAQRHGGGGLDVAGEDGDDAAKAPMPDSSLGVDVSYHTPEWHAMRLAALTTERVSWDDFKKKKAEKMASELGEEKAMREYRLQLDADRAAKLSRGTNNEHLRLAIKEGKVEKKKKKRSKDEKKKKKKKHSSSRKGDGAKDGSGKEKKKKKKTKSKGSKKRRRSGSRSDGGSGSGSSGSSSGTSSDEGGGDATKGEDQFRLSDFMHGA